MNRALTAVAAIAVLATAIATPASATAADPTLTTVTVVVTGAVFIPDSAEVTTLPKGRSETLTITAPAAELDAVVDQRLAEAAKRLQTRSVRVGGGVSTNATHTTFGSCGMSYVTLRPSGSETQGQAYVESGFALTGVKSATSYWTTTSVFKTGWAKTLNWSGNLNGATEWSKGTRVDVPKKGEYSARLSKAKVTVVKSDGQPGSCSTLEPEVNGVYIHVT